MRVNVCPGCRRFWDVPDGEPVRYCRPCTLGDLGLTEYDLALMVEFHLSYKALQARLEKYGGPDISPKEWLTPRTRLRPLNRPRQD